uniref:Uncharacterized protein n=1 Tax=Tanacetum cinerariifolium TaxID=118510 RepID=A0A6L2N4B0_TANCI|nr:hypothetical protein [Tanacetum cinerariifolium]
MLVPLPLPLLPLLILGIHFLVFTSWDLAYGKVSEATDQALGLLKVNSVPSGLVSISPTPDPSTHDDPSVNSIYGSCRVLITDVLGEASFGFSTRKSARIWPFTDVCGWYVILCSPSMMLYFFNLPVTSGRDITCLMGWSMMTTMGCAWKYLRNLLAAQTGVRTSFSIGVLKSGKDFSVNLEMNLFKITSFPLRLQTSLIVCGDRSCSTTSILSGHDFIPSGFIMYPRNIPYVASNSLVCGASVLEAEGHFCVAIYPMTGEYPSRILSRCSTIYHGTPIMSDDCHANISKFLFKSVHSSVRAVINIVSPIDSTTDSHYYVIHREFKHSVSSWISLILGLPMMSLYGDGDLTIIKIIHAYNALRPL